MAAITRSDFRNALFTLLSQEQTTAPTLLRKVHRYRPGGVGGIGESPVAWVGDISQELTYDGGTRTHDMTADVILAAPLPTDALATSDPIDSLISDLVELFTTNVHGVNANTILSLDRVVDGDVTFEAPDGRRTNYRGATLTLTHHVLEGRI